MRSASRIILTAVVAGLLIAVAIIVAVALDAPVAAVVLAAAAVIAGAVALAVSRAPRVPDPGRRRLLTAMGLAGAGAAVGGLVGARVVRELTRPDARRAVEERAASLGEGALRSVLRGYHPGRSGDLQLVLKPFNTANYPHESRTLEPRDPRSSHALVWPYTDRIPFVIYAPGIVEPQDRSEEVTLADLAPTTAALMGFDGFEAPDGGVMPGISAPPEPPRVVVTVVIDGGGWNVLTHWPEAWPTLRRLMREGALYRDGWMGSFPNVTASAHATVGTGAFPRTHGISGHHLRQGARTSPAFGELGRADPGFLLVPTLADAWNEETGGRAWVGEIGHQIWHLGMLGRGGDRPVAIYFDEARSDWASQNPDLYRMPGGVPPRTLLSRYLREYFGQERGEELDREAGQAICCDPPIVRHQGDLLERAFREEPIGESGRTDLLYVNFKTPDYAGHASNMLSDRERISLEAVDRELGRLVGTLERRFRAEEFALIVTADHGQVPLVDEAGGVRLDPIELTRDLDGRFWSEGRTLVESVRPSEVFLREDVLRRGVNVDELAAALLGYRYEENLGAHTPPAAVQRDRLDRRQFAAVLPGRFVELLTEADARAAGGGRYPDADPGVPPPIG